MMSPLLFLYLSLFPFGQLLSFQVLPFARVHSVDIAAVLLVLCWFLQVWRGRKIARPLLATPMFSFLGVAAFSLALGGVGKPMAAVAVGASYLARLVLYFLFYFGVSDFANKAPNQEKLRTTIYNSLLVCGAFIVALGLLGYVIYPDTRALSEFGWDNHYYRLIGPFLDPAFTGMLLVFFLILVVAKTWEGWKQKVLGVSLFLLGWSALALTYSRASYLAIISSLIVVVALRKNWKLFILSVLLSGATFLSLPHPQSSAGTNLTRTATVVSRWDNYKEAVQVGLRNPAFGVGYNLYAAPSTNKITHIGSGVHSSFLFVLATTGIAGLVVYLYLWFQILLLGWKRHKTVPGLTLFASTAALLMHSIFDNSLFYPWVVGWLGILLALQVKERK